MNLNSTKFKQTEIGEIPEDWKVKSLGEVVEVKGRIGWRGYTINDLRDSGSLVLGGTQIVNNKIDLSKPTYLSEEKYLESPEIIVKQGDIIITKTGNSIGDVAIVDFDIGKATINPNVALLKSKENINSEFLYYWLINEYAQNFLKNGSSASAQPAINQETIRKLLVVFPKIDEQQNIVSIFSSLDNKIELNLKMNKTLEEIGKTLFKSWFVDFEFPNENGKPYKSCGGKMVDSELGKIPEGWGVKTLKEICSITNGGTPSRQINNYWENKDILWIKTGELNDGVIFDSEEKISKLGLQKSSAKLLPVNSIVIAIYAAPTVGRLGILKHEATTNQACTGLVVKTKYSSYLHVYYWLLNLRNYFNSIAVGAAQQNISKGVIEETKIVLPTKRIIENSKLILESIWNKITQNTKQISNLSLIKDSLLPRLMSGKLRI
ncbi:hypothetical protein COU01_01710 [Candidatus Falkowbacteria bacterium CG10_big_fil_rev_8_21_14_0_10_44_15]|uniref:Type I restriction modification DNA specificity domain-containing protein n=1 Tax=Candidatus Falkowbacteria bacterium CG10_big_fil_rev_8_21_14_0_10_44_15 TaxID=1974569 RepID=A0A2H0V047_9BACT|nr:MAG: hypothetical protein COU01_01710 [Candidatus Falkowbacteria bacterium CG10_big_fil_rev_8_21_14_0_10_44_15]